MGVTGGAQSVTLGLGQECIELIAFEQPGQSYPENTTASDLVFQHFAIVVSNMKPAYERLVAAGGWRAISRDGPQRLPESSGGVTAFKFRDPDGHPLELLAFADGQRPPHWQASPNGHNILGIDHSAISVADTARSISFYEGLGFAVAARSLNFGREQEQLDNVPDPHVEVTALTPHRATPHIELLCYRSVTHRAGPGLRNNDVAATRLALKLSQAFQPGVGSTAPKSTRDPDGHHLLIVPARNGAA